MNRHQTIMSDEPASASGEAPSQLAQLFYQQTLQQRSAPLFWVHDGNRMQPIRRSEVTEWISLYARGIQALNIARGARIAMLGAPSDVRLKLLLAHALIGNTTIALADNLNIGEKLRLLDQSHVSVLIVEDAREALTYLQNGGSMPELQAIISLHGSINLPHRHVAHYSLDEVIQRGRSQPDRTSQWLQSVKRDESALLIGAQREDVGGSAQHIAVELSHKTHAELMQSCANLNRLLADVGHLVLDEAHPVLVHGYFHHVPDFIACQILPLTMGCSISYLSNQLADTEHFHMLQPQLLISDSAYIAHLQQRLERMLTHESDAVDRFVARILLRLGKKHYETPDKLSWWEKKLYTITHLSVSNRVRRCIGYALKAILSVDEGVPYATQLFFESFGVRVVEVPAVFEKEFEKRRL